VIVADHPIGPEVDDLHLECVGTWPDGVGDLDAKGRLPQDAQVPPVEGHGAHHLHATQIEE